MLSQKQNTIVLLFANFLVWNGLDLVSGSLCNTPTDNSKRKQRISDRRLRCSLGIEKNANANVDVAGVEPEDNREDVDDAEGKSLKFRGLDCQEFHCREAQLLMFNHSRLNSRCIKIENYLKVLLCILPYFPVLYITLLYFQVLICTLKYFGSVLK